MEELKVCHICLVMDVKMYDLQTPSLNSCFLQISGTHPQITANLSPYACYECSALVKKYSLFKLKCLQGQALLYGLISANGEISKHQINQIDREKYQIISNISYSACITENDYTCYLHDDTEVKIHIKDELYPVKEEEIDFGFGLLPDDDVSSDDDNEPLSHHKEKKENKERYESNVDETDGNISEKFGELSKEAIENLQGVDAKKRRRGRPRKYVDGVPKKRKPKLARNADGFYNSGEDDMDQYCTIITLSMEEQLEEINKRKTSSNYLKSPFQCNFCYKGFIDTHAWNHHVAKHAPATGDIECAICKFRFKTKRALQKHSSNHEKKYSCKSCPYVSTNITQAKQHQRWHKGVTYKCQHCDDIFTKWTSYMSHVRIKHPSEFICGGCGYSFISRLGLAMHNTMMHKDTEANDKEKEVGPYCSDCDVKFVSEEAYKRHMVMSVKHTTSKDAINGCRVCGERFPSAEDVRLHHRKQHARKRPKNYGKKPNDATWPAKCEHCSEEIVNAREYWSHFRRAHPDKDYPIQKNYVCDVCGKSFRGNAFLVYHKRTHTEERAYKCGACGKAFHNRNNLQVHEKTHSDHRPYSCSVCLKAFKVKGALNRHFRSHTGDKPYECEVCGKAFSQSNSRKLHVRTVHLKQPAPYVSRARHERRKPAPPPGDPPAFNVIF